ncbi:MAG: aldo/keto reductase [Sedimentibacter sp.]|jgi:predicted aldo/keto reductase-like oxidoreductase|nr:aldo/keto reductase [Sedimentibacter sp.]
MKAKLGLGGYFTDTKDNPASIIRYAYDFGGVRFFDTSPVYGTSEQIFGHALKDYPRESYELSTKTKAKTVEELHSSFLQSLFNLNTNYIDMYFGHSAIDDDNTWKDFQKIINELLRLKSINYIKKIGVSGHSVSAAIKAINSGLIDVIMVPHSIMYRKFEGVIQLAKSKNIEVITMKNFASGILLGGPDTNEYKKDVSMQDIINFSSYCGDIIIPTPRSINQFKEISNCYLNAAELNTSKLINIESKIIKHLGTDFCRFCNECRPCPKHGWQMSQPSILKAMLYQSKLGIDGKERYSNFAYNVNHCEGCDSECSHMCPFGIDIKEKMQNAHNIFTGGK